MSHNISIRRLSTQTHLLIAGGSEVHAVRWKKADCCGNGSGGVRMALVNKQCPVEQKKNLQGIYLFDLRRDCLLEIAPRNRKLSALQCEIS